MMTVKPVGAATLTDAEFSPPSRVGTCAPIRARRSRRYAVIPSNRLQRAESAAGECCRVHPYEHRRGYRGIERKEFARYLDISIKSTYEVEYQLQLARDYAILLPDKWKSLSNEVVQIRRMMYGLR